MKKYVLVLTILVSIAGWSGNCFSQTPGCPSNNLGIQKPLLFIYNTKDHPDYVNGTYFGVSLNAWNPSGLMWGLERISAKNYTYPDIFGHVYEYELTATLRHLTGEFLTTPERFVGQYGMYELKIERSTDLPSNAPTLPNPFICYTDPIEYGLTPLPIPKNLKVSFESGATTPTFSFDPLAGFPSDSDEWYVIRIYDKDYTRRIYMVTIGGADCVHCSKTDGFTSVTFPDARSSNPQTYEDLVPGKEYLFRAELSKLLPGGNAIQSVNFKSFKVPEK